jgi:hypothetical protein
MPDAVFVRNSTLHLYNRSCGPERVHTKYGFCVEFCFIIAVRGHYLSIDVINGAMECWKRDHK